MRPEFLTNDVDIMILDIVRQGLETRAHELPEDYLQLLIGMLSGANDARDVCASFPFNATLGPFWNHVGSAISGAAPASGEEELLRRAEARPSWDDSARECLARAREVLSLKPLTSSTSHAPSTPDN